MCEVKGWGEAKFKIQWLPNKTKVKVAHGVVNPPFAVHKLDGLWCITHLPSGLSLRSVSGRHQEKKRAIEVADYLRTLWDGWSAVLPGNTKELADNRYRIQEAVEQRYPSTIFSHGGDLGRPERINA